MKHCFKCQKVVNTRRISVDVGIAEIWNDHCEECGNFIDSGLLDIKKLNDHDLVNRTWFYNDDAIILECYKGHMINSSHFMAQVDNIHPCYIRKINIAEGWAVKAFPVEKPESFKLSDEPVTFKEVYNIIKKSGFEFDSETGDLKMEKFKFKSATLYIYDEMCENIIFKVEKKKEK